MPVGQQPAAALPLSAQRQLPIINALWIGTLSPLERLCLKSFVIHGHRVHLYSYDPIANVPDGVVLQDAGQILPRSLIFQNQNGKGKGSMAGFSDLFRYKLLLDRGGWWVDTDVFCLQPFDFAAPYVFGAEDKPVASGVIKMPLGSPLAQRRFELASQVRPDTIIWNELVMILERSVRELDLMKYVLPPHVFSPIVWHEVPDYVRGKKSFIPGDESCAVHLYNEMWRRKKLDKWGVYPQASVISVLRRQVGWDDRDNLPRPAQRSVAGRVLNSLSHYLPWRKAA